jgi:sugar lactone lactonase YvrE
LVEQSHKNPIMKTLSHDVKISGMITFVFFMLWSACKESDDPIPPTDVEPTLTGFSPTSGAVGTVVTLTGTNFSTTLPDNTVKFNGTVAIVSAATTTSLTVAVPTGATTGKISVQVDNHVATSSNDFTVGAAVAPLTLTSFSPTTGTAGTIVALTGTNFSPITTNNAVKFNGTLATISAATATSLTVEVPAGGTTGKITVQVGNQIATSVDDFVYVANTSANKNTVVTVAGNGTLGFADGNIADARFYQPSGVAVDVTGNIYVADSENHRIRKITPGGTVSTLAGSGTAGSAEGVGTAAQFKSPRAVAVDATGNVFVADGLNHKIRKITPAGEVSTLAGSGAYGFADGDGINAKFYFPKGIALDASGNLYVADDINHRIRKITPTGTVSTLAGSTSGSDDGDGINAKFNNPRGVTLDADGNIYVADAANHRIRMITPAGTVSTIAGSIAGIKDDVGTAARFNTPVAVAVDASGNIYVADDANERIRKITTNGTVSTLAGGFLQGFTDGVGGDALFRSPTGLAIDASGNIYVADRHNHSIRKIQ